MWKVIAVLIITSFFTLSLAKPGLPMLHDSNPHIARMVAYHTALQDGQYPPMWAKEVLGGIGSPVMMLNYQLPYMLSEGFVRLGFGYFDSYKLVLALSLVTSGLFMYLALRAKYGDSASMIGALIYSLAPYRFVDIYVRGALGESLTFIFPPLLIWGYTRRSTPLLIIGWTGLFLTHPVASAAFSAFFLGYCLIKKQKFNWLAYLVALMIAMFNLLPTLALTEYTYYSPTLSDTLQMFPTFSQLISSNWGYGVSLPGNNDGMSFAVGLLQWLTIITGTIFALKSKSKTLRYLVSACWLSILFILPISIPIYTTFNLTAIIDFPWRLLFCVVFASAWMSSELTNQITKESKKIFVAVGVTIVLIIQSLPMARTDKYWDKPLSWFARETGDSYGEYAPLTRDTRDSSPFGKRAEFVSGEGEVTTQIEKSNHQSYRVIAKTAGVIRINTAYFPGWVIPENCSVSKRTLTHIDDSGLIVCNVATGEQDISIKFVAPTVQKIGNLITLLGIGIYLWILYRSYYPHTTNATR